MSAEKELIENKLAYIRDNLFDESDAISDGGYDLIPSFVGSPYEVLCGIETKLIRQGKEAEKADQLQQDFVDTLVYLTTLYDIEAVREAIQEIFEDNSR